VRRLVRESAEGHVLVFLPGAAEIRRAAEALAPFAEQAGIDLLPLHGDLPPDEQDRAVRPGRRRKVLLSTNVAESSVTIDGVAAVVDSGLARIASHSPWSGLPSLEVRKVSRASAAQRAGRAGRQGPGRCVRLYTRHDHDARPEFETPEIEREDLAETLLAVAALAAPEQPEEPGSARRRAEAVRPEHSADEPGSARRRAEAVRPEHSADEPGSARRRAEAVRPEHSVALEWFEPPPAASESAASALLIRLGATADGALTPLGRELLRFPLHPRLGRLLVEAARRGVGDEGALLAALLGERDLRDRRQLEGGRLPATGPSDLLELAHLFEEAERSRFDGDRLRRMGVNPGAARAVDRSRKQLLRLARSIAPTASPRARSELEREEDLLAATLAAFPDRVGRRRAPGSDEVVLVGGGSARLDPASVVREAPLLVALDAEERKGDRRAPGGGRSEVRVRVASAVTQEMLLDLFPDALRYVDEVTWNDGAERVDAVERLLFDDLVLEESRARQADPAKVAALLHEHARGRGARAFTEDAGALDALAARIAFVAEHAPEAGLAPPTEEDFTAALRDLCEGRRSFAELREADLPGALLGRLDPKARGLLERLAPERVTLPGGRGVRVNYEAGRPPWIESRLQDFFGMAQGPALADGRVPLVLHLLAPNQRAVQVTTDLAGFWERHYPALRRELGRRYPRHAWPEDPRHAAPPAPRGRR
jgi:ATP-dependent helicase HrpB